MPVTSSSARGQGASAAKLQKRLLMSQRKAASATNPTAQQLGESCAKAHKKRVLLSEARAATTQEKADSGIGKTIIIAQISTGWESKRTAGDKDRWRFSKAARYEAETNAACVTQAKPKKNHEGFLTIFLTGGSKNAAWPRAHRTPQTVG